MGRLYAMATPGRVFDMFTNQACALRGHGGRRPGGSLMLFGGGRRAAALLGEPDVAIADVSWPTCTSCIRRLAA